ncbi:hypothetical protein [Nakamurella aerolata]|uniref:O-antigen ligase n=1 Tax=Nakamurella aerolata TaxID=1656892 RepID=A0A849A7X5_9ACTN|nr:hypothetical protein [Nakamurella aerolata]NNG35171.1 hypothetical protein [Nakamurella aerolata]
MTVLPPAARALPTGRARHALPVNWPRRWLLGIGAVLLPLAVAAVAVAPQHARLVAAAVLGGCAAAAATAALVRRPELLVWAALVLFSLSGELQLRVSASFGLVKDALLVVAALATAITLLRKDVRLARVRRFAPALAPLAVLVGLYLVNPAGSYDTPWLFGTRLLLSALALLLIGLLTAAPGRSVQALVRCCAVLLPFEAVFAWAQQFAGADALVFSWGYEFGSQVRLTSTGGLRTSGTFQDPFQLAALAVIGLAVALFLARPALGLLIGAASLAVLAAADVRTAFLQAGVLLAVWVISRGFWRQALLAGLVAAVAGILALATITTSETPGGPEKPLLLSLNGRSTSWALAVTDWQSVAVGNGVGDRGIGSTRVDTTIADAPSYDPTQAPTAVFAGNTAFLDSAYAQVLSDVGIVGVAALIAGFGSLLWLLLRGARPLPLRGPADRIQRRGPPPPVRAAWAGLAVLLTTAIDWIGRASLASYTTGYLTMLVLGVLAAAAVGTQPRPGPPAATPSEPDRLSPPALAPMSARYPNP